MYLCLRLHGFILSYELVMFVNLGPVLSVYLMQLARLTCGMIWYK